MHCCKAGPGMRDHIDGLMQERRDSIAKALELSLSCTNPSTYHKIFQDAFSYLLSIL